MNDLTTFPAGGNITMSSREIADLCEKRHGHVLRDIEQMLQDIAEPKFGLSDFLSSYTDSTGRSLKEYRLPKDLTVTLITGYRADLRYKVIKRLEELEAGKPTFQVPQSFGDALRLAADQAEQIEAMKPKVAAIERLEASEGSVGIRVAAKVLGVPERKFTHWLHAHRWAFWQGKARQGYAERVKAGYVENVPEPYVCKVTGEDKVRFAFKITACGLAKLAEIFEASGAPA